MGYLLEELTINELDEALKDTKTIILPVGIIEQHGFHLPLCTDTICAVEIPRKALGCINAVVAPAIPYCYSGGELTGTVNVRPNIFSLMTTDICFEFVRMGFKNIIVFLGHGGDENTRTLKDSLEIMQRRDSHFKDITIAVAGAWQLSKTWMEFFNMAPEHDWHAGWAETSVIMYLKPELVRNKIVMDKPEVTEWMRLGDIDRIYRREKKVDNEFVIPEVHFSEEIKVGIFGFPEKASAELGKKICSEAVKGLEELVNLINREE